MIHPHGSAVAQAPVFPCAAHRTPPCPLRLPAPIPGCPRTPFGTTDMGHSIHRLGSGTGEVFWQGRALEGVPAAAVGWDGSGLREGSAGRG